MLVCQLLLNTRKEWDISLPSTWTHVPYIPTHYSWTLAHLHITITQGILFRYNGFVFLEHGIPETFIFEFNQ